MLQQADTYSRPNAQCDADGWLVVRASAACNCRRALWYAAAGQEETNPASPATQAMWRIGHILEPVVVEDLRDKGWQVSAVDPQDPVEVAIEATDGLRLTGHPDAWGSETLFDDQELVIEVKTRGHEEYRRTQVMGNEVAHPEAIAQGAVYSLGVFGEIRDVVIATMNRDDCALSTETIPAERVQQAYEHAVQWLGGLEDHYAAHGRGTDELPRRDFGAGHWRCQTCPFLDICRPPETRDREEVSEAEREDSPIEDVEGVEPAEPVSYEDALTALREYEECQEAIKYLDQDKRGALALLGNWLHQMGQPKARLEGREKKRTVSWISQTRYNVDYKRLNHMLTPDDRREIVTESESTFVRVS